MADCQKQFNGGEYVIIEKHVLTMKKAFLILLAILTLAPCAVRAQDYLLLHDGWGWGFQAGVGGLLPTGSLSDDFKGCALFTGGINAEYNNLRIKADIAYGQPSFKNENPYAVFDNQGRNLQLNATANPTLLGTGLQVGYTVWRQGKVSVTPMVGMSWNRLSWDINHIKYEADDAGEERPMIDDVTDTHESSLGWMASVDIDFKLHGKVVDFPFGEDRQGHYTSSLRITPFVTHTKYSNLNPSVKGCCVGLTVSYAGLFHALMNLTP
jgi:hypothetical protein